MAVRDVVLPLQEELYMRLEQTARATRQSLTDLRQPVHGDSA